MLHKFIFNVAYTFFSVANLVFQCCEQWLPSDSFLSFHLSPSCTARCGVWAGAIGSATIIDRFYYLRHRRKEGATMCVSKGRGRSAGGGTSSGSVWTDCFCPHIWALVALLFLGCKKATRTVFLYSYSAINKWWIDQPAAAHSSSSPQSASTISIKV